MYNSTLYNASQYTVAPPPPKPYSLLYVHIFTPNSGNPKFSNAIKFAK